MTTAQAVERLELEIKRQQDLGFQYWPMFLIETGQFVGCAGLRPWSMAPETIEAGVHLMRSAWGLRLGEEALRSVLAFGFKNLNAPYIVAGHGTSHENSRSLLARVGFEYTHNILWGPAQIEVCMWKLMKPDAGTESGRLDEN